MPRLTIRLSESEHARLHNDAIARGVPVSRLVRERLGLAASGLEEWQRDIENWQAQTEGRVSRLEELAGL